MNQTETRAVFRQPLFPAILVVLVVLFLPTGCSIFRDNEAEQTGTRIIVPEVDDGAGPGTEAGNGITGRPWS